MGMEKIKLYDKYGHPLEGLDLVRTGMELMKEVVSMGYSAYIVGGCVRDLLIGKLPHDIDIATNMPIDIIKQHYKTVEYGGGERYGTVIVRFCDEDFELTQFRSESTYSDNRRPDEVAFAETFKEDTLRRDFTINAMGIGCDGEVVDYHGGLEDIKNKIIRTVGNPEDRFTEDSLRILRASRFAAKMRFEIDKDTQNAMEKLGETVNNVSRERIRDEFEKSMESTGYSFGKFVRYLDSLGIMRKIFPEYHAIALRNVCRAVSNDKIVNFALLFSDSIQKIALENLKLKNSEMKAIRYCINSHHLMRNIDHEGQIEEKVKIVTDDNFSYLIDFYKAYYGQSIDMHKVLKHRALANVYELDKDVNAYIASKGITGAKFGQTVSHYKEWVFKYRYDFKVLPLRIEWEQCIDNFVNDDNTQLLWADY